MWGKNGWSLQYSYSHTGNIFKRKSECIRTCGVLVAHMQPIENNESRKKYIIFPFIKIKNVHLSLKILFIFYFSFMQLGDVLLIISHLLEWNGETYLISRCGLSIRGGKSVCEYYCWRLQWSVGKYLWKGA